MLNQLNHKFTFIISLTFLALSINSDLAQHQQQGRRNRKLAATKTRSKSSKKCHASKESSSNKPRVICLSPGDSIQDALDKASDDTVIRLSPGDYVEAGHLKYGLRISNNNIKLIGTTEGGNTATRILHAGDQQVGVYAAPEGCEFKDNECDSQLFDFTIEGIVVEGFPKNGIQTRFVRGFEFRNCKSINNLNNGLYPTLSMNGTIQGCTSTGSLDAAIWVAGSRQVAVLDNNASDSITGIEVTVSKDLLVAGNTVFNNVVGIGMYHANMAGTSPDFPPYDNWVFENNRVYDNNRENDAPEGSFQGSLPNGVGVLMVGIRGETVRNNVIEGNDMVGLAMLGFCTVQTGTFGVDCEGPNAPEDGDPSANDNTIIENIFSNNGNVGIISMGYPGVDLLYLQSQDELLDKPDNNCFADNVTPEGEPATFFASDFSSDEMPLPSGGCK